MIPVLGFTDSMHPTQATHELEYNKIASCSGSNSASPSNGIFVSRQLDIHVYGAQYTSQGPSLRILSSPENEKER